MPGVTMAILYLSQALMISSSEIEPPGWIMAFMPARAASFIASALGKKASEARQELRLSFPALRLAIITESTLDIWPAPIPAALVPQDKIIALDLTCLATFPAKIRLSSWLLVGFILVTTFRLFKSKVAKSLS